MATSRLQASGYDIIGPNRTLGGVTVSRRDEAGRRSGRLTARAPRASRVTRWSSSTRATSASCSRAATTVPETGTVHDLATADFAPVVTHPGKIICQGLNYRSHILEMGHELPEHPTLFAKFREALIGAHDDIVLPAESDSVDWEAELALVIGTPRRGTHRRPRPPTPSPGSPSPTTSRCATGSTARSSGCRARRGSTPPRSGPWLVTPDEVGGPDPDLEIGCEVDGVVRQASRTSELVFSPADLVAYVSEFVTLEPGDLLLTGTPAGVGHGMHPPTYLRPARWCARPSGTSASSGTAAWPKRR